MSTQNTDIQDILAERGKRYGKFDGHAGITQDLKRCMQVTEGYKKLNDSQKESLEMIAHKIGRILNGDPNYDDSWDDIAGYAKLVADEIREKLLMTAAKTPVKPRPITQAELDKMAKERITPIDRLEDTRNPQYVTI